MSTVLGIDLSLTCTGLALIESGRIIETRTVKTSPTGNSLEDRERRLADIVGRIRGAIDRTSPYLAVIEAPSFGSRHGSAHDRSGLWWLVVRSLYNRNVLVAQVAPTARAKYGTGNGRAEKKEVHAAVKANYGSADLPIKTNDEADAVLLAAMGSRSLGQPVELVLPDRALEAMEKVQWPL